MADAQNTPDVKIATPSDPKVINLTDTKQSNSSDLKITNSYEKTLFWLFTSAIIFSFITFVLSYTPQNVPIISSILVPILFYLNIVLFIAMLLFSMMEIRKGNKALGLVVLIYALYSLITILIGSIEGGQTKVVTGNVIANILN